MPNIGENGEGRSRPGNFFLFWSKLQKYFTIPAQVSRCVKDRPFEKLLG